MIEDRKQLLELINSTFGESVQQYGLFLSGVYYTLSSLVNKLEQYEDLATEFIDRTDRQLDTITVYERFKELLKTKETGGDETEEE